MKEENQICRICKKPKYTHVGRAQTCFGGYGAVFVNQLYREACRSGCTCDVCTQTRREGER